MPIFSLKCFRTDTQVARNRVRGFGLLKPHTVPARIVSPLSGAFSTLSAFQVESVEQPWDDLHLCLVPSGLEPASIACAFGRAATSRHAASSMPSTVMVRRRNWSLRQSAGSGGGSDGGESCGARRRLGRTGTLISGI